MVFKIEEHESLLRMIVKAIEKGIGEDIREYLRSTDKATNNAIGLMRADNINTNLRDSVASDTVELKYFNRSAWTGCLLIDRQHQVTYTICSKQTLDGIPKQKDRKSPHYLQTILHIQNSEVEAPCQQLSLGDYMPEFRPLFSDEDYQQDYARIMEDDLSFDDDYTHLVIVYEAEHFVITSITVKLLNADFQTAQEYSLEKLLKPDFSELTASDKQDAHKKDSHALVSVKHGLKKAKDTVTPSETIVIQRKMEDPKQA